MARQNIKSVWKLIAGVIAVAVLLVVLASGEAISGDLPDVKTRGVLRHLGVPYANFVTGSGDGLDVELMQMFAGYLGVRYEYVSTDWGSIIGDLSGKQVKAVGDDVEVMGEVPVKGDVIASGFTMLPWREKVIDYGSPTFPTQVWLIARFDSPVEPIRPSGKTEDDIAAVKALLSGKSVLGKAKTCLDPDLYDLCKCGANVKLFEGSVNELAPAVINGDAEMTILDVPDTLVALQKWPGKIKVIGPVSEEQQMGCAFAKSSPRLRGAFNLFLAQCQQDGTYERLVKKYYPTVTAYYPKFFESRFGRQDSEKRSDKPAQPVANSR